jgi:hypothetical protein
VENEAYMSALQAAVEEQADVQRQILELEKRYYRLEETVATLIRLINDEDADPTSGGETTSEVGLTDTVRNVLKTADDAMTPVQVRDGVIRMGKNESDYTNLLASIHNILKRLVKANEIEEDKDESGKTCYRLKAQRPDWFGRLVEYIESTGGRPADLLARPPKKSVLKEMAMEAAKKTNEGQKLPTMKTEVLQKAPTISDTVKKVAEELSKKKGKE